jgi:hypothetical protein
MAFFIAIVLFLVLLHAFYVVVNAIFCIRLSVSGRHFEKIYIYKMQSAISR